MSIIHEALKKAEREREPRPARCRSTAECERHVEGGAGT